MRSLAILFFVLAVASLVVACAPAAPSPKPAAAPPEAKPAADQPFKVRYQTLMGRGVIPVAVIKKRGIDKKYNLDVELTVPASPAAMNTAILARETDVILTGWTFGTIFRARGEPFVSIYPGNVFPGGYDVLVRKDSPIRSLADLKGKEVGTFAGPGGTTTTMWQVEMIESVGFDPFKGANVTAGASPLLMERVLKGDLAAALLLDPFVTMALASGDFRSIAVSGTYWHQKTGAKIPVTTFVTTDDFVKGNPEGVRRFLRALKESYEIVQTDSSIWPEMAKEYFNLDKAEQVELVRERNKNTFATEWNDKVIDQIIEFAELARKHLGDDFLPSVPRESFSAAIQP
ncbi:MAG: ABC transporter substrate-binding protein [Chloroflexi bacterium]|nr:ABC transporter substrate-binding protein [Chloroflexota bacterium]